LEKGPRKATDVLLDLESKIDILTNIIRSQDLNIKILSNKLNGIVDKINTTQSPNIKIEAVDMSTLTKNQQDEEDNNIKISSDFNLSVDNNPQGFRRTSRPETFSGDNMYVQKADKKVKADETPTILVSSNEESKSKKNISKSVENTSNNTTSVPVIQRIVDKNGKSIFLADVEITNNLTSDTVFKTRTNGTGKWMASLTPGEYKIIIKKRESMTKEKLESTQIIIVDGSKSPFELPIAIIK
jgi:hypothetical protein